MVSLMFVLVIALDVCRGAGEWFGDMNGRSIVELAERFKHTEIVEWLASNDTVRAQLSAHAEAQNLAAARAPAGAEAGARGAEGAPSPSVTGSGGARGGGRGSLPTIDAIQAEVLARAASEGGEAAAIAQALRASQLSEETEEVAEMQRLIHSGRSSHRRRAASAAAAAAAAAVSSAPVNGLRIAHQVRRHRTRCPACLLTVPHTHRADLRVALITALARDSHRPAATGGAAVCRSIELAHQVEIESLAGAHHCSARSWRHALTPL